MTTLIIIVFLLGYLLIATESFTKINKAAFALLMCVICWVLYSAGDYADETLTDVLQHNLGEASTTIFFLMGAMTIVEIVDQYGGFNFVRDTLQTTSKRALLWRMSFITAFLSAVLDNLTTTIVMLKILHKLVSNHQDRVIYSSMIVIAANAGGAFSPIGDVTTIMLWNGKMVTSLGVLKEIFIPSIVLSVFTMYIFSFSLIL